MGRQVVFLRIKLILVGVVGSLSVLYAAYARGRASQRAIEAKKTLENYKETRERIDEAANTSRTADDARKWLRDRNK